MLVLLWPVVSWIVMGASRAGFPRPIQCFLGMGPMMPACADNHVVLNGLVAETNDGKVSGFERRSRFGREYQLWTGIPYAQPPVGNLRFEAPLPAQRWEGVLQATKDPPPCLQPDLPFGSFTNGSEDCLYLNVYRPKITKLIMPVIFYIHQGAFQVGFSGPEEVADYLMDEDVVLVRIQYRLSVLGFMSLGDAIMPGNFGLKDQVLALKWIKRNIAAFGGNPNSVTAFGVSSGSASAHILLKSPACDDLVNRAFSNSGAINKVWTLLRTELVRDATLKAAEESGCSRNSSREILECFKQLDVSQILKIAPSAEEDVTLIRFLPVIEPKDAKDAVATFDLSKRPTRKPWVESTANGDWGFFKATMVNKPGQDVRGYLTKMFSNPLFNLEPSRVNKVVDTLEKRYFSSANTSNDNDINASKMLGDLYFQYPALANILRHKGPKWFFFYEYYGSYSRAVDAGAGITENIAFHLSQDYAVFKMNLLTGDPLERSPEDVEVSKRMIKYLVNFAYYANPAPNPVQSDWRQFRGYENIFRITGSGDFPADRETAGTLAGIEQLWESLLGW